MRKNWWLYLVVVVLCVVGLIASGCAKPAPEEEKDGLPITPEEEEKWVPELPGMKEGEEDLYFKWKMGLISREVMGSLNYRYFADEMRERTNGHLDITPYWAGVLGTRRESPFLIGANIYELGQYSPMYFQRECPLSVILDMPFFVNWTADWQNERYLLEVQRMWDYSELHPMIQANAAKMNLMNLFMGGSTVPYMFYTRKGVKLETVPDSWKGKMVRAPGYLASLARSLGALPVDSAMVPNAYEAFQKGMLDITLLPPGGIRTQDLAEVMEGIWLKPICKARFTLAVNLEAWEALPQYIKDIAWEFMENDRPADQARESFEDLGLVLQHIDDTGLTKFELTDADWDRMVQHGLTSYQEWEEFCTDMGIQDKWKEYFQDMIDERAKYSDGWGAPRWDLYLP